MSLDHIRLEMVTEADLASLISAQSEEAKRLEFKRDLQIATDDQKREFLSDVTSLANADGGDLIFGVRADYGVAAELVGLRNFVPDDRICQLENLLRDSAQPRVSGIQMCAITLTSGTHALIIRIPRSFASPHMVRHSGVTRFCGRNNAGKYDLDVNEIRSSFLASEGLADKLKNFRLDRINRLISGGSPVKLTSNHLIVLHVLPVVSARPDLKLSASSFKKILDIDKPRPIGASGWSRAFNIDGLIISADWKDDSYHGYVQIFRNGFLESVESQILTPEGDGLYIASIAWERDLIEAFPSYLRSIQALEIPPPYVVSVSLLNVRDYRMYVGPGYGSRHQRPVDRDHLLTDDILVEDCDQPADIILRPLFDQIWNACGWERSINYKDDGRWGGR